MTPTHDPDASPFHDGERFLQRRVGAEASIGEFARVAVRAQMPDQHRAFYAQLPFLVTGSVDAEGQAWASLLTGQPGFAKSPDPRHLDLTLSPDLEDPIWRGLEDGDAVGLLGIELETRRRNRMNGAVTRTTAGLSVTVEHSFGNCPQYIQRRTVTSIPIESHVPSKPRWSTALDADARAWVEGADTFYVASYVDLAAGRQVDVSHRGGKPGFVRVGLDGTLSIPDFSGNRMFNTLGNLYLNPRAGLMFANFETGDVLQLTGAVEIVLEGPEVDAFEGAERIWRVKPEQVVLRRAALDVRARDLDASPNSLTTGSWSQAQCRLDAERTRSKWRRFRVERIVDESAVIRSFVLAPVTGVAVRSKAGQHVPIRVSIPGHDTHMVRTYTLSSAPSDDRYRLSVKREGLVSSHLHDAVEVGDEIEVRGPSGDFTIDAGEARPAVLLAGGVGITPLLAMLRHLVFEGQRTRHFRPAVLFYAARSEAERAFIPEIEGLIKGSNGAIRLIRALSQPAEALGTSHEVAGHVTGAVLQQVLPLGSYDFYLCGPPPFMTALYSDLHDLDVPDPRIHMEHFGPASVERPNADVEPLARASQRPIWVQFGVSGPEVEWTPGGASLLELAEGAGLEPAYGCRSGSCGSCVVKVESGAVTYARVPVASVSADEALLCCARPADGVAKVVLAIP